MRGSLLSVVSVVVSLGLGGCGGCEDGVDPGRLADAPPPPDAPDDAAVDGDNLPVTLTVTHNGAPQAGVLVYFQNADGSLVRRADTDATGKASAVVVAGGFVTAIDPFPRNDAGAAVIVGNNDLHTFAGVKPGDQLQLTRDDQRRTLNLQLRIEEEPTGARYEVMTTCGTGIVSQSPPAGAPGGGSLTLVNCPPAIDLVVFELDGESGGRRSALQRTNLAIADGATLDLTGATFQPLSDVSFSYGQLPGGAETLQLSHSLASARGPFATFSGSIGLEGSTVTQTLREPTIAGSLGIVHTRLALGSDHHVLDWGEARPAYELLNVGGLLLPGITEFPTYETGHRLAWTEDGTSGPPDLTLAGILVLAPERTWRWSIAAPYRRGELAFPTLPTDVADWTPGGDAQVIVDNLLNARVLVGGYDAVRPRILNLRQTLGENDALAGFVTGPTGRVLVVLPQVDVVEPGTRAR